MGLLKCTKNNMIVEHTYCYNVCSDRDKCRVGKQVSAMIENKSQTILQKPVFGRRVA